MRDTQKEIAKTTAMHFTDLDSALQLKMVQKQEKLNQLKQEEHKFYKERSSSYKRRMEEIKEKLQEDEEELNNRSIEILDSIQKKFESASKNKLKNLSQV